MEVIEWSAVSVWSSQKWKLKEIKRKYIVARIKGGWPWAPATDKIGLLHALSLFL
jgi:hypothetical protein